MKHLLFFIIFCSYQTSGASSLNCVESISAVVNDTRVRINDLNRANKSTSSWSEPVFKDCVVWLENRSSYRQTCPGSSSEWKAIIQYFRQNTQTKLRNACNQPGCQCPNAISTISEGGLPLFLQRVNEMNPQKTNHQIPGITLPARSQTTLSI